MVSPDKLEDENSAHGTTRPPEWQLAEATEASARVRCNDRSMGAAARWSTGIEVDRPLAFTFVDVPNEQSQWHAGLRTHHTYRDLGLTTATGGSLGAEHVRMIAAGELNDGWHCHELDFQWFLVLKGWIRLGLEHGEPRLLKPGDTACTPPLYFHTQEFSPDFECVEVTSPAEFGTITGRDALPPDRAARRGPERPSFTSEHPETYVAGTGVDACFDYRDLGADAVTGGRIALRLARLRRQEQQPPGWVSRSSSHWFMVLEGSLEITVEGETRRPLRGGDAMSISSGTRYHLASVSPDYAALDLSVPAPSSTAPAHGPQT